MHGRPLREDVLSVADGRHSGGSAELPPRSGRVSCIKADGKDQSPQLVTIAWGVQVFPGRPAPLTPSQPFACFGVLDWGVNAVQHSARFDLGRGGAVTVTATGFHFQVENLAEAGPTITVRGTAGYSARPGDEPNRVTLTEPFADLAPGNPVVLPAPPFARMVTTFLDAWPVLDRGDVTLQFLSLDGIKLYEYTPKNCRIADSAELPNDVWFVQLVKSAPGPVSGALCFHLSL